MIRFLGFFMLALGGMMAFGAYQTISDGQMKTFAIVLLPLMYLGAGFGLLRFKSWTRHLIFVLATFHILLGILALKDILTLADFIPIVSLIERIPTSFLRRNPFSASIILITSHFVLPLLVVSYLSSKRVAVQFESWLQGNFSWGVPFLVVLASGFVFSYTLFNSNEVSHFLSPQGRTLFGFSLTPIQGQVSYHVELYLMLILALGLVSGGRVVWFLVLILALSYWLPFVFGATHSVDSNQFKFLFFGIGWIFTALVTLVYWQFFWQQSAWLEKRSNPTPHQDGSFNLVEQPSEVAAPSQTSRSMFSFLQNRLFLISLVLLMLGVLFGGGFYFLKQKKALPPQGIQAPAIPFQPLLRFEGSSIDSQGAYAVVNGNVVQVGMVVEGYQVDAIEADRVLLSKEERHYSLDSENNLKLV